MNPESALGLMRSAREAVCPLGLPAALLVASWLGFGGAVWGQSSSPAGADLFEAGRVTRLDLHLAAEEMEALRRAPRRYVRATVSEANRVLTRVGLHLKGSRGSYRDLDDKPSLTLTFDRFVDGQRFHGLQRIHLNNSVEDPTFMHEALATEVFRRAGVPAPRAGHALVQLNGRPLGLYVLKEGFTEDFLRLHFLRTDGNLYEPKDGGDVDTPMERDLGTGPDLQTDRKALVAAATEPDLERRLECLRAVLDFDRFLSFMAVEVLLGHRDGYCLAHNNFRLYHDPATGKMVFLPHGMDVLLGNPDLPVRPSLGGLVARAVLETSEGRQLYLARLAWLLTNVFDVAGLADQVDRLAARLASAVPRSAAPGLQDEAARLKQRLAARAEAVARQLATPDPTPLRFEQGVARPGPWRIVDPPVGGALAQTNAPDGRPALHIRAGPLTAASWRARVHLARGRYRFEARACLAGVVPLPHGRNQGVGVRVAGRRQPQPYALTGDSPWTSLATEFEVQEALAAVELVCELRASQGQVWFDLESLRLVRRP